MKNKVDFIIKETNKLMETIVSDKELLINDNLKELECILQKNIALDEANQENGLPQQFEILNERIKDFIVDTYIKNNISKNRAVKIYLDDKRSTPNGYIRAFWPNHVFDIMKFLKVDEISLDHDLCDDEKGTGYDVITYFEEKVFFDKEFEIPMLKLHTDNSSARQKMSKGIEQIYKMKER